MSAEVIKNRYEFVLLFDVRNGNPNGDPDAGNMPRTDAETGNGIVTDVCLKRKIRDYVEIAKDGDLNYRIYIKKGVPLNTSDNEAFKYVAGIENAAKFNDLPKRVKGINDREVLDYMCSHFYDIRTFGAVLTTMQKASMSCGQVRGPVQLTFAESVEPVVPTEVTITRVAITTEADAEKKTNEMGNKYIIPYGLYRCEGFVSANLAQKVTGFTEDDLELFFDALLNMFDYDRSAARGAMATRKLIIFKHDSILGNAPAHKLFDLVKVTRKDKGVVARSFDDYNVSIDEFNLPSGVTIEVRE